MELKALKDQLEVEKQMWEANSAKKEVGGHEVGAGGGVFLPSLPSCPAPQASKLACRLHLCGLPSGTRGFWLPRAGGVILTVLE